MEAKEQVANSMTEIEKKFFKVFGIGTPTIKCVEWDNGMFSHYDDWYYINRTFKELGIKMNINKLNALIKECKKVDPKNIKHDGYCFSNGCFVNAFITYPQITSDILLKLICILVQWDKDYEYLVTSKSMDDLKQEILNDCCIQSAKQFNEYFIEQVQSLFTERKI